MQESSFQSAFTDKNSVTSIPWYQTAIDIDYSVDVTMKAWYNLMVQIVAEGNKKVVDMR